MMESLLVRHDFILGLIAGSVLTLLLASVVSLTLLLTSDVYSLSHWKLNVRLPFKTMWMNLGYWKTPDGNPIQHFDDACQALLREVLVTSGVLRQNNAPAEQSIPNKSIGLLDLGVGCGDQTCRIAHLVNNGALNDIQYVGLTLNETQANAASGRIRQELSTTSIKPESFKLFCANAAQPHSWSQAVRSAVEDLGKNTLTERWLLALDCLYHFSPSRQPIFEYAARDLDAQLMAFDLMLNTEATLRDRLLVKAIGLLMGCPLNAFLTEDQYESQLVASGYDRQHIAMRDISPDVFPGLVDYLGRQEGHLRQYGISLGGLGVAKKVFGWFRKAGVIRAVIIVARRKGKQE